MPAVLVAVAGVSASWAVADDLNPPTWRGQPHSTFQHWTFPPNNPSGQPDEWVNPNGTPIMSTTDNAQYFAEFGGRIGVWGFPGDNHLRFDVPNHDNPDAAYKVIWVQVTWFGAGLPGVDGITSSETPLNLVGDPHTIQLADGWFHTTWELTVKECPDFETIWVRNLNPTGAPLYIDQVVIDTICVPAPASGLLALAGLVFAGRRRR